MEDGDGRVQYGFKSLATFRHLWRTAWELYFVKKKGWSKMLSKLSGYADFVEMAVRGLQWVSETTVTLLHFKLKTQVTKCKRPFMDIFPTFGTMNTEKLQHNPYHILTMLQL